jgi:hypothetical protein
VAEGGASWTHIAAARGSRYTTPSTTTGDSGSTFRVVVSNSAGSVTECYVKLPGTMERVTASGDPSWRLLPILPAFGSFKLRALHGRHIKDFLARKRADGLAKNSARLIRATLSVLLSDAVDDGILFANPVQGITRRGRKGPDTITQAERQRKIRPMTVNQFEAFLVCARAQGSRREWTLFMTLADSDPRPGEALALPWQDFDEVDRALNVERAVSDREVKPTKSEARQDGPHPAADRGACPVAERPRAGGADRGHRALALDVPDLDGHAHRGGRDRQALPPRAQEGRAAGVPALRPPLCLQLQRGAAWGASV